MDKLSHHPCSYDDCPDLTDYAISDIVEMVEIQVEES